MNMMNAKFKNHCNKFWVCCKKNIRSLKILIENIEIGFFDRA